MIINSFLSLFWIYIYIYIYIHIGIWSSFVTVSELLCGELFENFVILLVTLLQIK